ncbi:MAG: hypothetical protein Q4G63_12840 [Bacteroidia bacterium]|nr:hypothetical protein [Bacteroidia bacterium]
MRKITLFFLLFPLLLLAQGNTQSDSINLNKQNWKFAAGVMLFGNMEYSYKQNKQPLVFNIRYAINNRHVIRVNIPITYNHKVFGEPGIFEVEATAKKGLRELPLNELLKDM